MYRLDWMDTRNGRVVLIVGLTGADVATKDDALEQLCALDTMPLDQFEIWDTPVDPVAPESEVLVSFYPDKDNPADCTLLRAFQLD